MEKRKKYEGRVIEPTCVRFQHGAQSFPQTGTRMDIKSVLCRERE